MERLPSAIRILPVCMVVPFSVGNAIELPQAILTDLGDSDFGVRERAQAELLRWSRERRVPSMDELLKWSRASTDPEVRERCMAVLREMVNDQYLTEGPGFVGIRREYKLADIPGRADPCHTILVGGVNPNTPASRAGIQVTDLIVALNGKEWKDATASEAFSEQIAALKPGTKVVLKVCRQGKLFDQEVILARRPVSATPSFFEGRILDPEAAEQAAMDEYFRNWLAERKLAK